jgi:hypothetical protein
VKGVAKEVKIEMSPFDREGDRREGSLTSRFAPTKDEGHSAQEITDFQVKAKETMDYSVS